MNYFDDSAGNPNAGEECGCGDDGGPDPHCYNCDGECIINDNNPNSQFDYYEIGGRWNKFFKPIGKSIYVNQIHKKDIDIPNMEIKYLKQIQKDYTNIIPVEKNYINILDYIKKNIRTHVIKTSFVLRDYEWINVCNDDEEFIEIYNAIPKKALLTIADVH